MSETTEESWLPNLVAGVSIWKLAADLNEEKFFDGRLLVPETEGSETLPSKVSWDLTGLVPLSEARATHAAEVPQAVQEFFECLERVGSIFADEASGFHAYKEAFTVPALESAGDDQYFFDPSSRKLMVVNWGASPRSITSSRDFLFGYLDFDQLFEKERVAEGMGDGGGARQADGAAGAEAGATADPEKDEKTEDDQEDGEGRPWWLWALLGVGALLALLALLWFLGFLRPCDSEGSINLPDGGVLLDDGAVLLADGAVVDLQSLVDAGADADAGSGGDASQDGGDASQDGGDGSADAGADADLDAGDASPDAGGDASEDGGSDGGADGGGDGSGGAGAGAGAGAGSGQVVPPTEIVYVPVGLVPGSGAASDPSHRMHFHPQATAWRISRGQGHVRGTQMLGREYHVWLNPGRRFDSVTVQWRDSGGRWHNH